MEDIHNKKYILSFFIPLRSQWESDKQDSHHKLLFDHDRNLIGRVSCRRRVIREGENSSREQNRDEEQANPTETDFQ